MFSNGKEDAHHNASLKQPISWLKTAISFSQSTGTVSIQPSREGKTPKARDWNIRLLGYRPDGSSGIRVSGSTTEPESTNTDNGLLVKVGLIPPGGNALIKLGPNIELSINDPLALANPVVFDAQIGYKTKEAIDDIFSTKGLSAATRASRVDATEMDSDLRLVLKEFLLADGRA